MKRKTLLKSRQVTLIEVLIATVLTMILLTTITFFYRQVIMINKESEKLQKEQFRLSYLEKRLSTIIPNIISPTDIQQDFYFFTSDVHVLEGFPSLVFTYDHGVNLEKNQSNHQLGKLFVDGEKNLVFASWPSPKRWGVNLNPEFKKEILAENVSELSFEFYVPPKKERSLIVKSTQSVVDILPENHWHKTWNYRYNQLPAMMKIHLTTKKEDKLTTITFAFSLPKSNMVIMYDN